MTTLRVCDCVYYGFDSFGKNRQRWRVNHHLKRVEDVLGSIPPENSIDEIVDGVIARCIAKEKADRQKRGMPHTRRFRYQICSQEDATHVELVGICGDVAPVGECEFIREVDWPRDHIEENRSSARRRIGELLDWEWE